jgi:hypothetical protein
VYLIAALTYPVALNDTSFLLRRLCVNMRSILTSAAASSLLAALAMGLRKCWALSSAVGGNTVSILLGDGDGRFELPVPYSAGITANYVVVADFNNDNKLDRREL